MLNKNEIIYIILASILLGFLISLNKGLDMFLYFCLILLIIILTNIFTKKITAYYLESEIEVKLWEIKRYGFRPTRYFKKPFPGGIFIPLITTALSFGYITWLKSLIFEVKPKTYRAVKRHGLYSFSEMTESHIGLIAASGVFMNLILAVIGYLANLQEFSRLNIYFAFYSLIPFSNLDGNKIFFGNLIIWSFLSAITLIGLFFAIFII